MDPHSRALADIFGRCNDLLVELLDRAPEPAWRAVCAGEGWTVGVVAHHVAVGYRGVVSLVAAIMGRRDVSALTWDFIHDRNARQAAEFAAVPPPQTLALLRRNGTLAFDVVRNLDDAALQTLSVTPVLGKQWSVVEVVERVLIGHVREHTGSIRAALHQHSGAVRPQPNSR